MFAINNEKTLKKVKCQFCYSSTMEEIMSLHVMAEPELHPICRGFVMHIHDGLPQKLQEEIDSFGELYGSWHYVLDLVGAVIDESANYQCDLPTVVLRVSAMPPAEFSYYMMGLSAAVPTLSVSMEEFRSWYSDEQKCREELEKRQYDLMGVEQALYLLNHAEEMKQYLLRILQEYWDVAFSKEWESISSYVKDIISYEEISLSHTSLLEYLERFHSQLKIESGMLVFDQEPKQSTEIASIDSLMITPSVFGDNHLHGNIYGDRVNMLLNLNYRALQISRPIPDSFFQLFRVLSDESRFKILKVLWNGDATTKEISDILRLAPSTISLHLKLLKEADLVTSSKVKKYVYYRLKKDKLMVVQEEMMNYLKY